MQAVDFEETLEKIIATDPRYDREAYQFVREALDHTQEHLVKSNKGAVRHVTGQELLEGIRNYGLEQYGPMTLTVLEEWGVHSGEDFGEIVFNMVEAGLLGKTEQDHRDDFKGGYNFFEAFRRPFIPEVLIQKPGPQTKPSKV